MCNRKFQNKIAKKFKKYHHRLISSQNRLEEAEKERKLKLLLRFVPARCVIENSKKTAKKFKKLKNTIKNSFQAKIGRKKMRKRETKIIVPFCSVPTQCVIENSIRIVKNSKKRKKEIRLWFISSQNRSENDEKYGK